MHEDAGSSLHHRLSAEIFTTEPRFLHNLKHRYIHDVPACSRYDGGRNLIYVLAVELEDDRCLVCIFRRRQVRSRWHNGAGKVLVAEEHHGGGP